MSGIGSFYPGADGYSRAFAIAEEFLAHGKSKESRPIANNTRLARVDVNTIAVVLHSTAVVTYHRDGRFTIYGGGWNTVTTKERISRFSPARPHSDGNYGWIVGYTGELTPARVQKCRTCKGRGRWMETDKCYGPAWHYFRGSCDDSCGDWTGSHRMPACEHGETGRHRLATEHPESCYRCQGDGRVDYGSKRVPEVVSASTPYLVNAAGEYQGEASGYPSAPSAPWASAPTPAVPDVGDTIVSELARLIPDVRQTVSHPVTGEVGPLHTVIVSLNDTHAYTREMVADWLETLDLDLRFPAAGNDERNTA